MSGHVYQVSRCIRYVVLVRDDILDKIFDILKHTMRMRTEGDTDIEK